MSESAIAVSHVSKAYALYRKPWHRLADTFFPGAERFRTDFQALHDVDFSVRPGEIVGVIGRNGCGKSTLLQIICGILLPSSGTVQVRGRISALLELGTGFNPEYTGRENVFFSSAIMGISSDECARKLDSIVDFAEIGEFIDRPLKTYSSGMYVRLAFATAISIEPEVLVVDEALAVGDIFFQQKCMEHMQKMMQGSTIVLVSHDMHAVTNLCQRVLVLEQGRVLFDGNPMEAVSLYTRLYHTARFGDGARTPEGASPPEAVPAAFAELAPWIVVDEAMRGGAGEVLILRVAVTDGAGLALHVVRPGEHILLRLLLRMAEAKAQLIFGYTVKDRVGNALFGENSLCLGQGPTSLPAGYAMVEYGFVWPEVAPNEYTITLGVGEGTHPFEHKIQCWAHNVVAFAAVTPDRCVHGMFNTPLDFLRAKPLGL